LIKKLKVNTSEQNCAQLNSAWHLKTTLKFLTKKFHSLDY